ncbi:MAG: hypothetical protein ACM35G_02565, partial [Planctomycetaceae bacterium]
SDPASDPQRLAPARRWRGVEEAEEKIPTADPDREGVSPSGTRPAPEFRSRRDRLPKAVDSAHVSGTRESA